MRVIKEVYLQEYILETIINYIYKNLTYFTTNFQNKNEIINYSLVNKQWYKIVSKLLTNKIGPNNIKYFKSFIQDPYIKSHQYKYINSIDSYIEYDRNNALNDPDYHKKYKHIVISDYIFQSSRFPDNFIVSSIEFKDFKKISKNYENDISKGKIQEFKFDIGKIDQLVQSLEMGIKKATYNDGTYDNNSMNIFFWFKNPTNYKSINGITIDDLFLPSTTNQSLTQLNHFTVFTNIYNIIEKVNKKTNGNVLKSWEIIVDFISNYKSLDQTYFFSSPYPNRNETIEFQNFKNSFSSESFSIGLKSILANSNCNIKSMVISSDTLNQNLYDGLILNQSVRDILLSSKGFIALVNNVLIFNSTIRNIEISDVYTYSDELYSIGLESLIYPNKIQLYSLTIKIDTRNSLQEFINRFTQYQFNIKEINIKNNSIFSKNKTYQFINNNTIYNIIS